jgi:hypothetical protein
MQLRFPNSGNKAAGELFLEGGNFCGRSEREAHVLIMPRDLIHRTVTDPGDDRIGYVRDLLTDEVDWQVRFLHVTAGGHLGVHERHLLIPVEAVKMVSGGFVTIDQSRQKAQGAPELDPNILQQPQLRQEIYDYYGYPNPK